MYWQFHKQILGGFFMAIYGYARVSTPEQNMDRQIKALEEFGVPVKNIYKEKETGRDFERPAYKRLMRKLRVEDVLVVKSIDRLGRNYAEILEQWRVITKVKGAAIVVLDMPILDTRKEKDLIGTLVADLVLQIMSYFAQVERDFIKQRQAEGIAAAKARGVKFGRPRIPIPENFAEMKAKWQAGKISSRQAGKELGVSYHTFLRWCKADS